MAKSYIESLAEAFVMAWQMTGTFKETSRLFGGRLSPKDVRYVYMSLVRIGVRLRRPRRD